MSTRVPDDELLTRQTVARRLRVDQDTVTRWIEHGVLEAVEVPYGKKMRSYRVKGATINKILQGEVNNGR